MRISDWSSDVCSSDLLQEKSNRIGAQLLRRETADRHPISMIFRFSSNLEAPVENWRSSTSIARKGTPLPVYRPIGLLRTRPQEHTSDLQSLIRISYAVFCVYKNNNYTFHQTIK